MSTTYTLAFQTNPITDQSLSLSTMFQISLPQQPTRRVEQRPQRKPTSHSVHDNNFGESFPEPEYTAAEKRPVVGITY